MQALLRVHAYPSNFACETMCHLYMHALADVCVQPSQLSMPV